MVVEMGDQKYQMMRMLELVPSLSKLIEIYFEILTFLNVDM